jgi:ParB-like chromosome segregation protein Spo0J
VQTVYQKLRLNQIIDHPINHAIYADNFDDDLVESVRVNGVLNPITVCKHPGGSFVCLSGHRRRQAAKLAGLTEVPAMVIRDDVPEYLQVIMVIESNRQRDKTPEQKTRETTELAKARAVEAKKRQKEANPSGSTLGKNVSQGRDESARALAQAAKETGLGSRPHAEKAIKVVEKIDELTAAGETVKAEQLREVLNTSSVSKAARLAETIDEPEDEAEPEPETVVDELGKELPTDLHAVFLARANLEAFMRQLSKLKGELVELCDSDEGRWIDRQHAETLLKDLRSAVKFGLPHTECGDCRRDPFKRATCKTCKARGWITAKGFDVIGKDGRQWLEAR